MGRNGVVAIVPMCGFRSHKVWPPSTAFPSLVVPLGPGACWTIVVNGPRQSRYLCESPSGPSPFENATHSLAVYHNVVDLDHQHISRAHSVHVDRPGARVSLPQQVARAQVLGGWQLVRTPDRPIQGILGLYGKRLAQRNRELGFLHHHIVLVAQFPRQMLLHALTHLTASIFRT